MKLEPILQRILSPSDWEQLQLLTQNQDKRPDEIAVENDMITEDEWLSAVASEFGLEVVNLRNQTIDRDLLAKFPTKTIFRHELLPYARVNGFANVAVGNPAHLEVVDELSTQSGIPLIPVLARRREIAEKIRELLGVGGDTINELVRIQADDDEDIDLLEGLDHESGELAESAQAPSVIRLVNELLVEAVTQKTSDVHIEPHERGIVIRFRVDGMLRIQPVPPEINRFASAIVTRIKIMSRLNIAEKRLPQDGRIKLRVAGREIDVRVSIIPMIHGEGIVLRLLDKDRMVFDLTHVGMPSEIRKPFNELIRLPHGIILVTGPTGSGKSTTLYSALNEIKSPETKIITVEDPVEYHSNGISQIQVHSKIGLTFAAGLRSILRHDPDVILIGEIRDGETAMSAIQASLTGHVVFSTLHTNDAPSAMTRLIDMGVEPYLVASTVEGVLAQRLIRRLCKFCKTPHHPHAEELPIDFRSDLPETLYEAVGCRECSEIGYAGRIGIFELLQNDPEIREMTVNRASAGAIRKHAIKHGMTTLRHCGWNYVREGLTSIDEVLRVTKGDLLG
ncbi:GspE/PulE family protein [Rubinisphaera margarita]|uniref:GspE/PulE family protein n=1 Tax=Rubinisphaera margarita TaxID=2909586 RepID=UPI001EE827C5|nr:ATPase, T2SS/T4P/T4SS family [Rubinisphaera margarita]MCG6155388.1 Flp pilus assembly complex ATPase component TadA [Rubinisphaera margarita]